MIPPRGRTCGALRHSDHARSRARCSALASLACALIVNAPLPSHAAPARIEFSAAGDFSAAALRSGVKATKAACERVDNAVWASTRGYGEECLRYWAAGFGGKPVTRALVFFHGDLLSETGVSPLYLNASMAKLQRMAEDTARQLDAPYVFFGRPGTYGSSGEHRQRRRLAESMLISAGLDQLKARLQVREWVIAGLSGGGHVTAALLTQRADIVCAVPTSAPSSPRMRWLVRGMTRDDTGYADSYEPTEHLQGVRMHPQLRVFVLGDPNDSNVFWPSQTILADKLKENGVAVEILRGEGTGPRAHALANSARRVAGWCHHGLSTPEILRKAAGLKG